MSLSIAIAVHNEEKNILKTLESVYEWVDEIVVVDGGSTDKTVSTIKQFGHKNKIRIFHEPNRAMFHENKQIAIEKCKGEWILQLDADEIVSPELKNEIINVISTTKGRRNLDGISHSVRNDNGYESVAFWLPRLNYFLDKPLRKGGQYPDYTIRLYRNGVAKFPCKSVHEQAEIRRVNVPSERSESRDRDLIGFLKSDLLHYPYPTFESYIEKWIRYSILEAEILKKQGIKPSFGNTVKYMVLLPKWWFFKTYFRHRGYADGFPGFVFSLFSSVRYWITYVRLYEITKK